MLLLPGLGLAEAVDGGTGSSHSCESFRVVRTLLPSGSAGWRLVSGDGGGFGRGQGFGFGLAFGLADQQVQEALVASGARLDLVAGAPSVRKRFSACAWHERIVVVPAALELATVCLYLSVTIDGQLSCEKSIERLADHFVATDTPLGARKRSAYL
jgi:hypothetical protein